MKTALNIALLSRQIGFIGLLMVFSVNLTYGQSLNLNIESDLQLKKTEQKIALGGAQSKPKAMITISDKLKFKPGTELDENNYSAQAEIWSKNNWGLTGSIEVNELKMVDLPKNSETKSINLKRKLININDSQSYLALGLGWQDINIGNDIDAEGVNISLLGKWTFSDNLQVYGKGAIFEGLNNNGDSNYSVTGYRFETGVKYKVGEKLSFSAGVKVFDLSDQQTNSRNISSSFLLGTHLSF